MLLNCGIGEDLFESLLDCKEIQPVNPKRNQPWIFIGRTDAEAEAPILWSPDVKNWLIGKDPDAGKDWRQEEKGTTENEMAGWPHWLNGHIWASSRSWWWTRRPGVLQSMGLQRVGHDCQPKSIPSLCRERSGVTSAPLGFLWCSGCEPRWDWVLWLPFALSSQNILKLLFWWWEAIPAPLVFLSVQENYMRTKQLMRNMAANMF